MKKAILVLAITFLSLPVLAGCARKQGIPVTTDFGRMLDSVPASVLKQHQVWFQDPGLAAQQAGFGQVDNYATWLALSPAQKKAFAAATSGAMLTGDSSYLLTGDSTYGWDLFMRARSVFCNQMPPYRFNISEGSFNATLIKQKFASENYTEASYAGSRYLTWGDNYETDVTNPFHGPMMADFNRVMVTNNTLITAPATDIMQNILSARAGKVESIAHEPAARAVADQMGNVYGAFITTPSDLTSYLYSVQAHPQFHISAARNWKPLNGYELAGIGYRKDGQNRYLDICVAYASAADAKADVPRLAARLKSYVFLTNVPIIASNRWRPLTDEFDVSAPVVTKYDGAATVTFHLRYLSATGGVSLSTIGTSGDMLFLMPDPTPYLAP